MPSSNESDAHVRMARRTAARASSNLSKLPCCWCGLEPSSNRSLITNVTLFRVPALAGRPSETAERMQGDGSRGALWRRPAALYPGLELMSDPGERVFPSGLPELREYPTSGRCLFADRST